MSVVRSFKCLFCPHITYKSLINDINNTVPLIIKKQCDKVINYLAWKGRVLISDSILRTFYCSKVTQCFLSSFKAQFKKNYVYGYFACIHTWCPLQSEEGIGSLKIQLWMIVNHPRRCWEPNLGPLKEPQVHLTSKPTLQPPIPVIFGI